MINRIIRDMNILTYVQQNELTWGAVKLNVNC